MGGGALKSPQRDRSCLESMVQNTTRTAERTETAEGFLRSRVKFDKACLLPEGATMGELTPQQKVEKIVEALRQKWKMDRTSARTRLHKFVCQGKCDWFRSRKPPERFELDLTEQQRRETEEIVRRIMKGVSKDKARREIHAVICHPIPE